MMEQFIGKVLRDRYRIQSVLGGQTGRRTFLANDLQTDCLVVVKLLLFSPDFTWEHLKLFEREAEVLKFLKHPAIPQYLDYFDVEMELGKGFALVQTYIEAKSLSDWIQCGRTFSEDDIKAIATELLKILDYLHSRQPPVIHRDIKPSNILLTDRSGNSIGQVYLIDLGSVQTAVNNSGTQTIVGTYGYMPLEQFGGQTTPASDLYALGATLIYLATGQHPDKLPQKEMRIQFEQQVNLSSHLIDWLKSMTEPSLDLRVKSVKQALKALEKPNLRKNQFAFTKPEGSKVQVMNTSQMFEIVIPPRGLDLELIFIILLAIPWNSFLLGFYWQIFTSSSPDKLFAVLLSLIFLGIGLTMIWGIIWTLFGKVRLCFTRSGTSRYLQIFGLRWRVLLTELGLNITKIKLIRPSFQISSIGNNTKVPVQISLWVGKEKFTVDSQMDLTPVELDWLTKELNAWLNLPISKDS